MDLVSMERTAKEKKAMQETMAPASSGPDYPWGLCLSLGKDELKKLGIDELPEVGDEFHLYAVAKVTNVHASASEGGEDSMGISLQITALGAMHEDDDEVSEAASKLYGKG